MSEKNQLWPVQFGARIKEMRVYGKHNQEEFARQVALSGQSSVTKLERGELLTVPIGSLHGLIRYAHTSGYSVSRLMTGEWPLASATKSDLINELTVRIMAEAKDPERKKRSREENMQRVKELIGEITSFELAPISSKNKQKQGYKTVPAEILPARDWKKKYVPILGRVAAGIGFEDLEADGYPPGWCGEYLEYADAPRGAIAVRVIGESMTPNFRDGDMLVVDTRYEVNSGVCCVLLDKDGEREAIVKEIKKKGIKTVLISRNPTFPPRELFDETIAGAYKIIAHLPRSIPDEE